MRFPTTLGRCALVGSSSTLSGGGHGAEIDLHDVVIRPNRILDFNETYWPDVGSRTDIFVDNTPDGYLFNNTVHKLKNMQQMLRPKGTPGGWAFKCLLEKGTDSFGQKCPAKMVVLVERKEPDDAPDMNRTWIEGSVMPIGEITATMHKAVQEVKYQWLGGHYVSAGFLSLLTLGPLCGSVSIYGFGGAEGQTIDHHETNGSTTAHNLTGEHNAIDNLIAGRFSPLRIQSPLLQDIVEALVSLAAAGNLKIVQ